MEEREDDQLQWIVSSCLQGDRVMNKEQSKNSNLAIDNNFYIVGSYTRWSNVARIVGVSLLTKRKHKNHCRNRNSLEFCGGAAAERLYLSYLSARNQKDTDVLCLQEGLVKILI